MRIQHNIKNSTKEVMENMKLKIDTQKYFDNVCDPAIFHWPFRQAKQIPWDTLWCCKNYTEKDRTRIYVALKLLLFRLTIGNR